MKTLEHFDHSVKKQNIEYFVHLVRIAMADDVITSDEIELLHRMGKKMGFTDPEIVNLIETTGKSNFIAPYELAARFEQVYDIIRMTLADGVIDKNEMRLATSFAANSGFKESEIPNLMILLINGIKQGKDHEDLFEVYKKGRKTYSS